MTCSTYRRITTDKKENTQKWQEKGPQRTKNQNFEKQKIAKEFYAKNRFLGQKFDL